jgi:hypothetical protein
MPETYRVRPKVMPFNWLTAELSEKEARRFAKEESVHWASLVVVAFRTGRVIATYRNRKDVDA